MSLIKPKMPLATFRKKRAALANSTHEQEKILAKKAKYTFIDLFAGVGGIRIAFERTGAFCIFSSEIDIHGQLT